MIGSPLKVAILSPQTLKNAARVANLPVNTGQVFHQRIPRLSKREPRGSTVAGSDAADLKRLRKAHVNRTAKMHNLSNHRSKARTAVSAKNNTFVNKEMNARVAAAAYGFWEGTLRPTGGKGAGTSTEERQALLYQLTTKAWGGEIIKKIKLECFEELKAEGHRVPSLDDI